jgi:hypothetical protein
MLGCEQGNSDQHGRREKSVNKIVGGSANPDVSQIPEHREIWSEEERGEKNPTGVIPPINETAQAKDSNAFYTK